LATKFEIEKGETMNTFTALAPQFSDELVGDSIQQQIGTMIDDLFAEIPNPQLLTSEQRRGILARYTAVLEGNFIYWMTATYLAVRSEEARPILIENLHEEIRDSHPDMMRRFAIAAHAFPSDTDALEVHTDLTRVRLFLGRLQGVQSLMMMAFFEGFIQRFMPYLAKLAEAQGSHEFVYTDVHGVCDVAHSQELFRAVSLEMSLNPPSEDVDLFEGVDLLRTLIRTIVQGPAPSLN
jgi:Iron-containing redox enzyme